MRAYLLVMASLKWRTNQTCLNKGIPIVFYGMFIIFSSLSLFLHAQIYHACTYTPTIRCYYIIHVIPLNVRTVRFITPMHDCMVYYAGYYMKMKMRSGITGGFFVILNCSFCFRRIHASTFKK